MRSGCGGGRAGDLVIIPSRTAAVPIHFRIKGKEDGCARNADGGTDAVMCGGDAGVFGTATRIPISSSLRAVGLL